MSNPTLDTIPEVRRTWHDLRPIGMWKPAQGQDVSETNPHGLFRLPDTRPHMKAEVIAAALEQTDVVVKNCLALNPHCQGVYMHGLTHKLHDGNNVIQFQMPTPLPPEFEYRNDDGDMLLDLMLERVHAADLSSGCLLRPTYSRGDFISDYTGRYMSEIFPQTRDLFSLMDKRIQWAIGKGMSIFYIDAHRGWTGRSYEPIDYTDWCAKYPKCFFMFESVNRASRTEDKTFRFGRVYDNVFPWSKPGGLNSRRENGQYTVFPIDHAYDSDALGPWPQLLTVEAMKARIRNNIEAGDIVSCFTWYHSRGYKLLRAVQQEMGN